MNIGRQGNNEKYNFGFRFKKCIKVYSDKITQISGKFVNDKLEGEVEIHFIDKTIMKGFAHSGHLIGPQRFFDEENGNFVNITETDSGKVYLRQYTQNEEPVALFGCHEIYLSSPYLNQLKIGLITGNISECQF